jgi:hypothetical protein
MTKKERIYQITTLKIRKTMTWQITIHQKKLIRKNPTKRKKILSDQNRTPKTIP